MAAWSVLLIPLTDHPGNRRFMRDEKGALTVFDDP